MALLQSAREPLRSLPCQTYLVECLLTLSYIEKRAGETNSASPRIYLEKAGSRRVD